MDTCTVREPRLFGQAFFSSLFMFYFDSYVRQNQSAAKALHTKLCYGRDYDYDYDYNVRHRLVAHAASGFGCLAT